MSPGPRGATPSRRCLRPLLLLAALCFTPPNGALAAAWEADDRPLLALVLDDLGWSAEAGERILDLPGALTLAVLPDTPVGERIATAGYAAGHEIILHQPMTPTLPMDPGPRHLSPDMDGTALQRVVLGNLAALPHRAGLSNHMGSLLTSQSAPMQAVMAAIAPKGVYFLDSRTTAATVAARTARDYAIPSISRDIFLDVVIDRRYIERALDAAVRLAERRGDAVVIGHPHAATLEVLARRLPALQQRLRLVTVSTVIAARTQARMMTADGEDAARPATLVGGERPAFGYPGGNLSVGE
ncbi:MAG: divergent polysaccharide deacetylase family protein [Pseudomonadales bacterium]|jgi:polysaccharide deacetylase 2 family uncharacterized protein YibQ|nr:divergent polysaccharide deacetylase family protein [Pseudomonadales bacterium]